LDEGNEEYDCCKRVDKEPMFPDSFCIEKELSPSQRLIEKVSELSPAEETVQQ